MCASLGKLFRLSGTGTVQLLQSSHTSPALEVLHNILCRQWSAVTPRYPSHCPFRRVISSAFISSTNFHFHSMLMSNVSRGFVLLKFCLGNTPNLQIPYCPCPIQVLLVSGFSTGYSYDFDSQSTASKARDNMNFTQNGLESIRAMEQTHLLSFVPAPN